MKKMETHEAEAFDMFGTKGRRNVLTPIAIPSNKAKVVPISIDDEKKMFKKSKTVCEARS